MTASVTLSGLRIEYGHHVAIDGLDLSIREGEFVVLLGPSGCGKSTLLNAIAGLEPVAGGRIEIGGADMTRALPKDRGIGMVFQSYALYPHMSVERNLSFALASAGRPKREIAQRVADVAGMLQLTPYLKRKPAALSGGQRQRVAIGRALVREAAVFLFDEPLSNLDAKLRNDLRVEIKKLHQRIASTMIYVTHDQVEAMTLGDRIAVMKGGEIQQFDTPEEIYHRPANRFVAEFMGAPMMNFLEGRIEGRSFLWQGQRLDLSGYGFRTAPQDGPAVLGLRPEHVHTTGPADGGTALAAQITLVEPMGPETVLWAETGGETLRIRAAGDIHAEPGQAAALAFDMPRAALFDAATGERL
ncbi:ABC transporter ATP-binding protein [Poseidonocella sp. HB161398]|uniref:ABC transporter ATP-binding protein n=1 Tax=Poseidonocella sp. HB161398 TaxID=2320855 RepID=UPI0011095AAB|nr:ABC transporter ATP-binding protein [Poseidonocella sp. HB161398]